MTEWTELQPIKGQKSFYWKANTRQNGNKIELLSYKTNVASIEDGDFKRHWEDCSVTTMNHINAFRMANGLSAISKK